MRYGSKYAVSNWAEIHWVQIHSIEVIFRFYATVNLNSSYFYSHLSIIPKNFLTLTFKSTKNQFLMLKTRNSWTICRDTLTKIEDLESERFFTPNGFFKIWDYSSGKNFQILGQYFVPTLRILQHLIDFKDGRVRWTLTESWKSWWFMF